MHKAVKRVLVTAAMAGGFVLLGHATASADTGSDTSSGLTGVVSSVTSDLLGTGDTASGATAGNGGNTGNGGNAT
ncbi:hypothetical protein, partial [Actinophytocola xanthii]